MIYETFREAVQNIWSNKFRTFLTMLGIIIGVTAVIVIVGLGNGMTQSIASSFADLGTNIISVQVMGYGSRSVEVEDVYSLVDAHPDLFEAVSPTASINGTVKVGTTSYSNTSVKGVSESYLGMSGYTVRVGRGINYVDLTDNKKICVVGDYISRVAYGGNAAVLDIKGDLALHAVQVVVQAGGRFQKQRCGHAVQVQRGAQSVGKQALDRADGALGVVQVQRRRVVCRNDGLAHKGYPSSCWIPALLSRTGRSF